MSRKKTLPIFAIALAVTILASLLPTVATIQAADSDLTSPAAAPQSDDFDSCVLNDTLWTFTDPLSDSQLAANGSQVTISMAAGAEHDLWEGKNQAPRLMQTITNEDFTVEAKFESAVTQRFQTQGILIEQDADNFVRVDFFHNGTSVVLFAASFTGGSATSQHSQALADVPATPAGYFVRVARSGNSWLPSYSFTGLDGDWIDGTSFNLSLTTNRAGIFGGNVSPASGQTAPAHTVIADYFFNATSPIVPEDETTAETLTITVVGDGAVSPESGTFPCGDQTLSATPDAGWRFAGWSGALTGTENPATLAMNGTLEVTATFEPIPTGTLNIYLPFTTQ